MPCLWLFRFLSHCLLLFSFDSPLFLLSCPITTQIFFFSLFCFAFALSHCWQCRLPTSYVRSYTHCQLNAHFITMVNELHCVCVSHTKRTETRFVIDCRPVTLGCVLSCHTLEHRVQMCVWQIFCFFLTFVQYVICCKWFVTCFYPSVIGSNGSTNDKSVTLTLDAVLLTQHKLFFVKANVRLLRFFLIFESLTQS